MKLRRFQIDAFADHMFEVTPAAVPPLDSWLPDALLHPIASENNLSKTTFLSSCGIRISPEMVQVDLCRHATWALAHSLFRHPGYPRNLLAFTTKSGNPEVQEQDGLLVRTFPVGHSTVCPPPEELFQGLGKAPAELWTGKVCIDVQSQPNRHSSDRPFEPYEG